jgi:hypothetical protein
MMTWGFGRDGGFPEGLCQVRHGSHDGTCGRRAGIEMSRLAWTGRDWPQLLELCSLSGVLLADPDGAYDPGSFNDRLVLGLKGNDERGRTVPDPAADAVRQTGQGRARRAGGPAADRVRPPPVGRGHPRSPTSRPGMSSAWFFGAFRRLGTLNGGLHYLVD